MVGLKFHAPNRGEGTLLGIDGLVREKPNKGFTVVE